MKNINNKQDRKFEKQLSHMQGFIGMPQWNGRNPSLQEIREYDRRILEAQAKGFKPGRKSMLKALFSWVMTIPSIAVGEIKINRAKDHSIKTTPELSGCG